MTTNRSPRAAPAERLRKEAEALGLHEEVAPDVASAVRLAVDGAAETEAVAVTGSLYTVGEARDLLMGSGPVEYDRATFRPLPRGQPWPTNAPWSCSKPDAVARGLVGEVIGRLERKGFRLRAMELRNADEATAKRHYGEHEGKPFFGDLVAFITSDRWSRCASRGRRSAPCAP